MKDVKAALVQCNWDIEAAFTELRKKGLAAVSKKASRVASEGLLALSEKGGAAAIVELNSETDFVARNEIFQHLASKVASAALSLSAASSSAASQATAIDLEALQATRIKLEHPKLKFETTVQEAIQETAAIMGENLLLRRGFFMSTTSGVVSTYLHASHQPGLGRTAGLVTLDVKGGSIEIPSKSLGHVGGSLAMHIVAAQPLFLSKDLVTPEVWEREKDILLSQVANSNKPEAILKKTIEGRLRKYTEEVVLLEQKFVMNDKITVRMVLEDLSKEVGAPVDIGCFLRLDVGEGLRQEEQGSPTEVAAQVG